MVFVGRVISLILTLATPFAANANEGSTSFSETVGDWSVSGYESMSTCSAWRNTQDGATKLTIIAKASKSTLRFGLENKAWRSLKNNENMSITATFLGSTGKITDLWKLSSASMTGGVGGPTIIFDISRASNDNASFINQFQRASSVWFWREEVPIAKFNLTKSSAMIESLMRCRTQLQISDNFDPFAE